jgi:protein-S-isoprenylcysteine O-methyltransferase Ste14
MIRARWLLSNLLFTVIVPGTVAGFIPWLFTGWRRANDLADPIGVRLIGAVLIVLGLPVLLYAILKYAVEGLGTPAPIAPTRHLVVGGPNRFVRNPMYIAVVLMIFGQALLLGQASLLWYGAFCAIGQAIFVHAYEEPTLSDQFGDEYQQYKQAVRASVPRLTPWHPPSS